MSLYQNIIGLCPYLAISLAISLIVGKVLIYAFKRLNTGEQAEAKDSPLLAKMHSAKSGTPTMGGLLILTALTLTLIRNYSSLTSPIWYALVLFWCYAIVGLADDLTKIYGPTHRGLNKWQKLGGQIVVTIVVVYLLSQLVWTWPQHGLTAWIMDFSPTLAYIFIGLFILTVSNAYNFTDGLDGLAGGLAIIVWTILAVIALNFASLGLQNIPVDQYPDPTTMSTLTEIGVISCILLAATVGFLWYNAHPAKIFLGDTGSLPVGALMGLFALYMGIELPFILIGIVFHIEMGSVVLQIISYRCFNKRCIFRCAPYHHHLEMGGWPETRVVIRLWILGGISAFAGLLWAIKLIN